MCTFCRHPCVCVHSCNYAHVLQTYMRVCVCVCVRVLFTEVKSLGQDLSVQNCCARFFISSSLRGPMMMLQSHERKKAWTCKAHWGSPFRVWAVFHCWNFSFKFLPWPASQRHSGHSSPPQFTVHVIWNCVPENRVLTLLENGFWWLAVVSMVLEVVAVIAHWVHLAPFQVSQVG